MDTDQPDHFQPLPRNTDTHVGVDAASEVAAQRSGRREGNWDKGVAGAQVRVVPKDQLRSC
jgi:hypothetical protein